MTRSHEELNYSNNSILVDIQLLRLVRVLIQAELQPHYQVCQIGQIAMEFQDLLLIGLGGARTVQVHLVDGQVEDGRLGRHIAQLVGNGCCNSNQGILPLDCEVF